MRNSIKGALLSGLVFPGLGQLWLKRYLRGFAFIIAVCGSMAVVVIKAAGVAFAVLEKAEREGGSTDLVSIATFATRSSATPDDATTGAALAVLFLAWIISAVDAYLVGRKLDLSRRSPRPQQEATKDLCGEGGGKR